jgi:purine-cytosine permease-like protein
MVVSSFAIGVLGKSIFSLGFVDAILAVLFFNLIGIIPVCYFSSMGPRFGLRQMVLSRFWFGWYGVKLIAVFNILACIGWSSVNCIVGAQLIHAVNNDVPGFVGILIIAICTFFVCLFGYKVCKPLLAGIPKQYSNICRLCTRTRNGVGSPLSLFS